MRRIRTLAVGLLATCFLVAAAGCSGADGLDGPAGKDGVDGVGADPSVNAIAPNRVFLDRTVDVSISGFSTTWTDAAKVDFGPGITVNSKRVASPTALVLNITISAEAATGPRDVTVTEGEAATTYKGAFDVASPLDLQVLGTPAQGSILIGTARQLDLSTPFDTTTDGGGLFSSPELVNLSIEGGAGFAGMVENASPFSLEFLGLVDVDAPAKVDVTVDSGVGDAAVSSRSSVEIAARAATALSGSAKGNVEGAFDSVLYKYTATADEVIVVSASTSNKNASPGLALLPASGKFANMLGFGGGHTIKAKKGDSYYLVYWDGSGMRGYGFDVAVSETEPEVEPNDACGAAQSITAGKAVLASLSDDDDEDWFAVTVAASDVGKKIRARTFPGDSDTDTVLNVLASDCTTSLGGPSDRGLHEDLTSTTTTAAGTYYVKVAASSWGSDGSDYSLLVTLE